MFLIGFPYQMDSHISHTWGEVWHDLRPFDIILASDILLYVSAYPSLVSTLVFLFRNRGVSLFVMSWKRRIAESSIFFDLMKENSFLIEVDEVDASVYLFTLKPDNSST